MYRKYNHRMRSFVYRTEMLLCIGAIIRRMKMNRVMYMTSTEWMRVLVRFYCVCVCVSLWISVASNDSMRCSMWACSCECMSSYAYAEARKTDNKTEKYGKKAKYTNSRKMKTNRCNGVYGSHTLYSHTERCDHRKCQKELESYYHRREWNKKK